MDILSILKRPLGDRLVFIYYFLLILLGVFEIIGGGGIPLLGYILHLTFGSGLAFLGIPLVIVAAFGLFKNEKEGLKIAFGAQLLFLFFLIIAAYFDGLLSSRQQVSFRQVITVLQMFLNLSILVFLFMRLRSFLSILQDRTGKILPTTPELQVTYSKLNSQIIFQKTALGLVTAVGWGTATNWIFLRFFFDSPGSIERTFEGLGGIGLVFTFGLAGIIGALVSISLFSLFLIRSKRMITRVAILSSLISILFVFPLGILLSYPLFSLLMLFIGQPYVNYPRYESFLPVLPSLVVIIALNIFPIFFGYSFLHKKWLPRFLGLLLILISASFFFISYKSFDTEAQRRSSELVRINKDVSALRFQIYKPTYLPSNLYITEENVDALDDRYSMQLNATKLNKGRGYIRQRPAGEKIDYSNLYETPDKLFSKGTKYSTEYPVLKTVMVNGKPAKLVVHRTKGAPPYIVYSQVLEWVHRDTRIGIDILYTMDEELPTDELFTEDALVTEEELIKIAESMR